MNYIVFDTEDDSAELIASGKSGFDKSVTQIAAICYHDNAPVARYHNRGGVGPFKRWLVRNAQRYEVVKVFAHNLQYDLGNIFPDELDDMDLTMVGGRLIRARWNGLTFADSYNLFPTSVKKLGEALGLEKLDMDVRSKEYVFRDCEIPGEALARLVETCNEFGLDEPTNTLGGLCVAIWQAMGGENLPDHSAFSRSAIFGGRVEIFQPGGKGNILWTDINSLYPSVMVDEFPGEMRETPDMLKFGITRATVFIPPQTLAPLPFRVTEDAPIPGVHENAIIFPCGRVTGTWVNAELRNAVEHHGVVIERIHHSVGTDEAVRPYANFVREFYRRRISSTSEAYKLIYKLLMNNLYGQLGMGGVVTRTAPMTTERATAIRAGKLDATIYGDAVMFDVAIPLPDHVNYAHAAHVTAYGRIRLLSYLRAIRADRLIYCDTDSCFFFHPPGEALPFPTGKELGEMKIEGVGERIEVIAPKTYEIDVEGKTKSKAKGVPSRHAASFIATKSAEYAAPFKIKEAINFFDRANVDWEEQNGRMVPVLGKKKRGNARRLSVWRMVEKRLLSDYMKKTKNKKTGFFSPLVLGRIQKATTSKTGKTTNPPWFIFEKQVKQTSQNKVSTKSKKSLVKRRKV
jgi:hypothetical protein